MPSQSSIRTQLLRAYQAAPHNAVHFDIVHRLTSPIVSRLSQPTSTITQPLPSLPSLKAFTGGRRYDFNPIDSTNPAYFPCRSYIFNNLLIDSSPSSVFPQLLSHLDGVENFLLTHHHEDHSGNFGNILSHTAITPYLSEETLAILTHPTHTPYFPMYLYEHLLYGRPSPIPHNHLDRVQTISTSSPYQLDTIDPQTKKVVPGYVHFTPGHAPDHIIYHVPSLSILFTGDAYLTPKTFFFRSDEDVDRIIASCEFCLDLPSWDAMLCAHEPVHTGGKEKMREKLDYMVTTRDRILTLYKIGLSEEEIAQTVFRRASKMRAMFMLCGGDVSPLNIVRSTLFGPVHRDGVKRSLAGTNDQVLQRLVTRASHR
mmetsp:Transcript_14398/g.29628  ORF Transcript_14398/g.29628 Transcript_14398/m.29628 type:complete len:370 (+) Transcript_14398:162-1271(+)